METYPKTDIHIHAINSENLPEVILLERLAIDLGAVPQIKGLLFEMRDHPKALRTIEWLAEKIAGVDVELQPILNNYFLSSAAYANELALKLEKAGIERVCLLGLDLYSMDHEQPIITQEYNLQVMKLILEKAGIECFIFAGLDPFRPHPGQTLEERIDDLLEWADGLKLYSKTWDNCTLEEAAKLYTRIGKACANKNKGVTIHCSPGGLGRRKDLINPGLWYDALCVGARVNFAHGGGHPGSDDMRWSTIRYLAREFPGQVFCDTAFLNPEYVETIREWLGDEVMCEVIMWGSDDDLQSVKRDYLETDKIWSTLGEENRQIMNCNGERFLLGS